MAANDDETLRMMSNIRLSYPGNDTTVLRARTAALLYLASVPLTAVLAAVGAFLEVVLSRSTDF